MNQEQALVQVPFSTSDLDKALVRGHNEDSQLSRIAAATIGTVENGGPGHNILSVEAIPWFAAIELAHCFTRDDVKKVMREQLFPAGISCDLGAGYMETVNGSGMNGHLRWEDVGPQPATDIRVSWQAKMFFWRSQKEPEDKYTFQIIRPGDLLTHVETSKGQQTQLFATQKQFRPSYATYELAREFPKTLLFSCTRDWEESGNLSEEVPLGTDPATLLEDVHSIGKHSVERTKA
ncbi:hypothetical protein M231_04767 [Tremella mesenterica]|uniref:Uncharacterized protein n=1 Tax=Tremella mesenterica TaxID=5217 RepID=A0A4Q1BJR8_TREME|nr:uncharacterized protein TREMEDRAFT_60314 [Tremella mesenterica DSM 1558]EIW71384.1 hypothetical protein TREMEDRAFT_60314 [Tremella mesenterica DSM 1558]RXK37981.1 hypothetical protein M231_04767 [Tremella mesenterica]